MTLKATAKKITDSYREQILDSVRSAMTTACKQAVLFTDEPSEPIAAEYLFTVAVATSIAANNVPDADPFLIRLERDAKTFMEDCFMPFQFARSPGHVPKAIRRGEATVDREGRIDVTVYAEIINSGYWGRQPLCAIEVKGFNPQADVILEDLKRNLSLMSRVGQTENVLDFTVFAAFHSYGRHAEKFWASNEARLKARYGGYLAKLDLRGITASVETRRISANSVGRVIENADYDEWDDSVKHHFVGAIVTFARAAE